MTFSPITTSHFDKQFSKLTIFVEIDHHDKAYRSVEGLIERLIEDGKLLSALQRMGVTNDEFAQFIIAIGLRGQ